MLRLEMPAGEFCAPLYKVLDDLNGASGKNTLRATTRSTWKSHGILKDLKTVLADRSSLGAYGRPD